jgi:8-oxo-dGTP diphosphatase
LSLPRRLRALGKRAAILILRYTPLSWKRKRMIIWLLSPRHAVGVHAVLRDAAGRVLVLRSTYSRQWQLPGGGMVYHETPAQALRREVREETGLELRAARLAAVLTGAEGRGLHLVFAAEAEPAPIRLSEEHSEWRYVPVEELRGLYRTCVEAAG